MTTAWPWQASRNVIPTEGRDGPSGGICLWVIPNSEFLIPTSNPHISPGFVARPARRRGQWGFRPEGRGARTCGTSSTPRRENTSGCCASPAATGSWWDMRA